MEDLFAHFTVNASSMFHITTLFNRHLRDVNVKQGAFPDSEQDCLSISIDLLSYGVVGLEILECCVDYHSVHSVRSVLCDWRLESAVFQGLQDLLWFQVGLRNGCADFRLGDDDRTLEEVLLWFRRDEFAQILSLTEMRICWLDDERRRK